MLKYFNAINKKIKLNSVLKAVNYIKKEEERIESLTVEDLKKEYQLFRTNKIPLKETRIKAAAIAKEIAKRTIGLEAYDVQLLGSLILNKSAIAEMKTGEGKTLVSVIAAITNAAYCKKTHIITVNDYLAERDYTLMKPVYEALGLKVGLIKSEDSLEDKKESYKNDIVYGTSKTFVFDYLRDNIVRDLSLRSQGNLDYAIIDEVDSILIDEARIPMNMSSDVEADLSIFYDFNDYSKGLKRAETIDSEGDFYINLKDKSIEFTEEGFKNIEDLFIKEGLIKKSEDIYTSDNLNYLNNIEKAVRANYILEKNVDYVTMNGEIVLIDENSGRLMPGRRWNSGLHQAVEAKEKLEITSESITIGSITLQNYFKKYKHLSGMTGTALTEEEELLDIYNLEVYPIPTNQEMIRLDKDDLIFTNKKSLFETVVNEIKKINKKGQPILIGTQSLDHSEVLSGVLTSNNIKHSVLNAKNHSKEAKIIAEAGLEGSITISTNMAGRGTDIMLGGNKDIEVKKFIDSGLSAEEALAAWNNQHDKVVELGGLYVIGIERGESRRLDNQLIGRSGRQGDPGTSIFYISLEDELLKPIANQAQNLWASLGIEEQGISHKMISRTINNAQKKREGMNYNVRKQLLKYDNINSEQRNIIYNLRDKVLNSEDFSDVFINYVNKAVKVLVREFYYLDIDDIINNEDFLKKLREELNFSEDLSGISSKEELIHTISNKINKEYIEKRKTLKEDIAIAVEKEFFIRTIDKLWVKHLSALENMRKSVSFKVYANKNPLDEYQTESLDMFRLLLEELRFEITSIISNFSPWLINQKIEEEEYLKNLKENSEEPSLVRKRRVLPIIVKGAGF